MPRATSDRAATQAAVERRRDRTPDRAAQRRASPVGRRDRCPAGGSARGAARRADRREDRPRWRRPSRPRPLPRAQDARIVTASAIPSEKLRPGAPDVAIPPIRSPAARRARANSAGRSGRLTRPIVVASPGARWSAISPPLLTQTRARPSPAALRIAARISSATPPATAAIGVMNASAAYGATAASIRRATGPRNGRGLGVAGVRKPGSSAQSSFSTRRKRVAAAR